MSSDLAGGQVWRGTGGGGQVMEIGRCDVIGRRGIRGRGWTGGLEEVREILLEV